MIKKVLGLAALSLATIANSGCHKGGSPVAPDNNMVFNVGDGTYVAPTYDANATCEAANPNDNLPDDDALVTCIMKGGDVKLQDGEPGYLIKKGIHFVGAPMGTYIHGPSAGQKAKIVADPSLDKALFFAENTMNLHLENLIFDGNKYQRPSFNKCVGFPRATNVLIRGGQAYINNNVSTRAVCGSAIDVAAANSVISNNYVDDNGYDNRSSSFVHGPNPWSDGITVGYCDHTAVINNTVIDSSDLGIVSGGGQGCVIQGNKISQYSQKAFGGLAVHNFDSNNVDSHGDHTGSIYRDNIIESAPNMMDTGISLGIHYWFPRNDTFNGRIENNTVRGAIYNFAIEGAIGTYVQGNKLEDPTPGNIAVVPCDDKIYANLAVGHMDQVCLQYEPNFRGITFDNGNGKCSYGADACSIAAQMPDTCPSKAEWQSHCTKR